MEVGDWVLRGWQGLWTCLVLLVVSGVLAWLHWGLPVPEATVLAGHLQQLEVQAYYLRWLALRPHKKQSNPIPWMHNSV